MPAMSDPATNTDIPAGPGGNTLEREELRDIIEQLTPSETPFYSNIDKTTTRALRTDWPTVALPAITAAVAEKRGFVAAIAAPIVPERIDNICELTAETGGVADSYRVLDTAGREDQLDFQKLLKGRLIRRRVNKLMYANQAKALAAPSTLGTFGTYITGARFKSVATTPGTPGAGEGAAVWVAGTGTKKLTNIDWIDDVMEACYATNGQPKIMYMSPKNKRAFSRIPNASVAENRVTMSAGKEMAFEYIGVVDAYLSDFGDLEIAMDRDASDSEIFFVDPEYLDLATLPGRAFKNTNLAKVGSAEQFMIEWEGTLRVLNPTAHGMLEGVGGAS